MLLSIKGKRVSLKIICSDFFPCLWKIVFLILLIHLLVAQTFAVEIKGRVLNSLGIPVAEAKVFHQSSGNKTTTGKDGGFRLNLPEREKIRIEVTHPDYIEKEVIIPAEDFSRLILVTLVPYIIQREEVVVTAMRHPESSVSVPAAETVVPSEILQEKLAPNITESLISLPGVSSLGTGGFSLVPNIRGLARRRVLLLIDNARVTSDRRTGPNASFVDPLDIQRIEVLRSPSSVFYGSDAIGGIIHILTKKPSIEKKLGGNFNLKFGTVNQEKAIGISLEGSRRNIGYYLSLKGTDAENYSSPLGKVRQSQFTQGSILGKISYVHEKREIDLSFLGSRGYDIGKANVASSTNPTWYPKENQNLIQLHWLEKGLGKGGQLNLQAYLNPNFLETKTESFEETEDHKNSESYSKMESLDFGVQLSYSKKAGNHFHLTGGMDIYGRTRVKATAVNTDFDPAGNAVDIIEDFPFTEGNRRDYGFFLSVDYAGIKNLDLTGGVRWDSLEMRALPGDVPPRSGRSDSTWTGFIGGSFRITDEIVLFSNLSKAYRAPGLSELFYTGITGRGSIIAQPGLESETSFNLDGGLKLIYKRFFAGIYAFYYKIDDLIERYRIDPVERIYTYGNVDRGVIRGYELEVEYYPVPGWKIFGNYFSFKGESKITELPLNDIPPSRIFLGTRVWLNRFSAEINATFQQKKENPGPAEVLIPEYQIVNLKASYFLTSDLRLYFVLSNLFNRVYLVRPDPDGVEEPGRNFVFGLHYSF